MPFVTSFYKEGDELKSYQTTVQNECDKEATAQILHYKLKVQPAWDRGFSLFQPEKCVIFPSPVFRTDPKIALQAPSLPQTLQVFRLTGKSSINVQNLEFHLKLTKSVTIILCLPCLDYALHFPRQGVTDYAIIWGMRSLTEFTVCLWMKSSAKNQGVPFSYAVHGEHNELLILDHRDFYLLIGGKWR